MNAAARQIWPSQTKQVVRYHRKHTERLTQLQNECAGHFLWKGRAAGMGESIRGCLQTTGRWKECSEGTIDEGGRSVQEGGEGE